ncbi:thiol reductase thioredoxin [Paenibacillus sp. HN-1]|uniref:thioredoxin family protein n=1 Tax=Paenibacillus TaxID=44249 RepID=UPI001CA8EB01|nr:MULTISPECIES: thioredoxin domain-containing protein [Paenibacillus]MBY9079910.1 thiol reductase thioredoxin [Paenibacillus sp. CGMCC 1.18879]MBY9084551.1 thiol reductase thioredoxin [Paenibacillus sinensis]
MAIQHAESAEGLREKVKSGGLVLVDYGAEWCAPCRNLTPILEDLSREYNGAVSVVKVDCDELPELAAEAGVMGLPTVVVYKGGQPVEKLVGLSPKPVYTGVISRYLS